MAKTDTPPQVKRLQYRLYRSMSPVQKAQIIFDANRTGQLLAMAGLKMQNPDTTEEKIWHLWAKRHLGEKLYNKVYGNKSNE